MGIEAARAALKSAGYDTHETATGSVYITGWDDASDENRAEVLAIVAPHGCEAEWVDDDLHIAAVD